MREMCLQRFRAHRPLHLRGWHPCFAALRATEAGLGVAVVVAEIVAAVVAIAVAVALPARLRTRWVGRWVKALGLPTRASVSRTWNELPHLIPGCGTAWRPAIIANLRRESPFAQLRRVAIVLAKLSAEEIRLGTRKLSPGARPSAPAMAPAGPLWRRTAFANRSAMQAAETQTERPANEALAIEALVNAHAQVRVNALESNSLPSVQKQQQLRPDARTAAALPERRTPACVHDPSSQGRGHPARGCRCRRSCRREGEQPRFWCFSRQGHRCAAPVGRHPRCQRPSFPPTRLTHRRTAGGRCAAALW
mmetsp:Transcript_50360/g.146399  ORF Transcript_50360/g.146399 Transcript_50360/m.146399 type:complete len:307 (+) Transcript_50360:1724-2644(+)